LLFCGVVGLVPISYESRLVKIKLDEQTTKKLNKEKEMK
jgi:hypothetical protein